MIDYRDDLLPPSKLNLPAGADHLDDPRRPCRLYSLYLLKKKDAGSSNQIGNVRARRDAESTDSAPCHLFFVFHFHFRLHFLRYP